MSIKFTHKGDFSKTKQYIKKVRKKSDLQLKATDIAEKCIEELQKVTPKDSGLTAESWKYDIIITGKTTKIVFSNTNLQNGLNVALLLEYGHATSDGRWIEGVNYIDPVIKKNYLNAINKSWKEMTKL